MIIKIINYFTSYFQKGILLSSKQDPSLLAQKVARLFEPPATTTSSTYSDLQGLQSASVGIKIGVIANLGIGSIATFVLDSLSVVSGMYLRKKKPLLGYGMIGYGIASNLVQSLSPFQGVFSPSQQSSSSSSFAQFINTSIGLPGHLATLCTSAFLGAAVPFVGFAAYKHSQTLAKKSISDFTAMRHWVFQAKEDVHKQTLLQTLWDRYAAVHPTAKLEQICNQLASHSSPLLLEKKEVLQFIQFLLENLPQEALDRAKESLLAKESKTLPDDPVQTALASVAIAGGVSLLLEKILWILTTGSGAIISAVITALTSISIAGLVASLLSSIYQTYQDWQAPDALVPQNAKLFSLARLAANVLISALLITGLFVPGFNVCLVVFLAIGAITSAYASYKRSILIQQQIQLIHASSPDVARPMQEMLHKSSLPIGARMKSWLDLMRSSPLTAPLALN